MANRKIKKIAKKEANKEEVQKNKPKPIDQEEDAKPFDFGGLPNRDLKKNLGCG